MVHKTGAELSSATLRACSKWTARQQNDEQAHYCQQGYDFRDGQTDGRGERERKYHAGIANTSEKAKSRIEELNE
jgi:hypothetical protein